MEKAGPKSGALARVVPIIGYDREMIRLQQDPMSAFAISLEGTKKILSILEAKIDNKVSGEKPTIIPKFGNSELMSNLKK